MANLKDKIDLIQNGELLNAETLNRPIESLADEVEDLGTDVESINLKIGDLSQLVLSGKDNLVDVLNDTIITVNEVIGEVVELIPQIDDTAGLGDTNVTWSADKTSSELADKAVDIANLTDALAETNQIVDDNLIEIYDLIAPIDDTAGLGDTNVTWSADKTVTAIQTAVTALVDGAPAEFNTINKLVTAVANDGNLLQTAITLINNRVRFDETQVLTSEQQKTACMNIGVGDPTRDYVAVYEAAKL